MSATTRWALIYVKAFDFFLNVVSFTALNINKKKYELDKTFNLSVHTHILSWILSVKKLIPSRQ